MSKTNSLIQFHFLLPLTLSNRKALKAFIVSTLKKKKQPVEAVNIVFCDDGYLLDLNKKFLRHDFYTDILSFPLSRPGEPLIAEIYISIDRVRENAKSLDITFKKELHRVIFHGILHFCGYNDKSSAETKKMRTIENKYLNLYFKTLDSRTKARSKV
jgi:probable rRNA maturation factor